MKVIPLHKNEKRLIKKALQKNRKAQRGIYERYSPKMLSVCRMYIKDMHYAEDVMLRGFFKVFKNLKTFKYKGSFEGWIRRIMVRESIDFLRAQKKWRYTKELTDKELKVPEDSLTVTEEVEQVQCCIDELPNGYKTVLMLFAVEGYKHREISELLGISENTSKSQLSKARKMLKEKVERIEKREQWK